MGAHVSSRRIAASDDLAALPDLGAAANLAQVVYTTLAQAITIGELAPGTRLREIPLSKRFGVSTTPIREALRRLEREGLADVHPYRGAAVAAYNRQQIINLYEIREILETRAVRRAAEAPDPRDLSRLEALLREMEGHLSAPDQIQFNRLDLAFHRALNMLGGNEELATLAERVHRQIQGVRIRLSVHLPDRPMVSHAEHTAILEAVRARDTSRAEYLVRGHIIGICKSVIQALDSELSAGQAL